MTVDVLFGSHPQLASLLFIFIHRATRRFSMNFGMTIAKDVGGSFTSRQVVNNLFDRTLPLPAVSCGD